MSTTLYVYSENPIPERSGVGGYIWSLLFEEIHRQYRENLDGLYRDNHVHRLLRVEAPFDPPQDLHNPEDVKAWVERYDVQVTDWMDEHLDEIEDSWPALDQFVPLDVPADLIPSGGISPTST